MLRVARSSVHQEHFCAYQPRPSRSSFAHPGLLRVHDRRRINRLDTCATDGGILLSRALLWTRLECVDLDKTSGYIQRSKGSPLEISLAMNTDVMPVTTRFF